MEIVRYLSEDGEATAEPPFEGAELERGYRALRRARHWDERAVVLNRQGRLGVYPPFLGQEAAQVGTALALEPRDWLLPSYRESGAALAHGLPLATLILYWRSEAAGWRFPEGVNVLPFSIPIATQLPQAVGVAVAGRHLGDGRVAMTYVGDGGTSEGDFHTALNFAGVLAAPVVFVVQNNGWAISVPTERQMRNPRIAERAAGYGIPGVRVDGNDLVAVWQVAREAVARARRGEGPTLIEALTYRVAAHTTSDDPGRYRDERETERWRGRDPVARLRAHLERRGLWDDAREEALEAELRRELEAALREADAAPATRPEEIVEHVFEEMTPELRVAWEALREDAARGGAA